MSRSMRISAAVVVVTAAFLSGCGSDSTAQPGVQPVPGAVQTAPAPNPGQTLAAPSVTGVPTAPQAPPADGAATQDQSRVASAGPPVAKAGDPILVNGSGWPAGSLVTATVCGNNFLNGSVDCEPSGAGQSTATSVGLIALQVITALPPKPCPCVIRVATSADANGFDIPFTIVGAPTAPASRVVSTRSVDVSASIVGSGPISAYFGGAAKRELVLSVTNTGSGPLVSPPLTLTFGKGQDPTTPLPTADGQQANLGTIEAGQTIEYRQPITIGAIAFGQYRVKGQFIGLDSITVNREVLDAGDLTFDASTSTYPWIAIILAWLLLQIPLLGLYKRRPVTLEPLDEDPLYEQLPVAGAAAGFAGGIFDGASAVPAAALGAASLVGAQLNGSAALDAPPPPPGFAAVGPVAPVMPAAAVALVTQMPGVQPLPPPPPVQPVPAMQPIYQGVQPLPPMPTTAPPVPASSSVFGVNDLRSMMNQPAAAQPPVAEPAPPAPAPPAAPAQGVDALRSLLQSPPPQQ